MSASVVGVRGSTYFRTVKVGSAQIQMYMGLFEITYRNLENNLVLVFTAVNILDSKL